MEGRTEYAEVTRSEVTRSEDFREVPSALAALDETLRTVEQEWAQLASRLTPVCSPPADEKMAEELRIGPSSEVAQAVHGYEARLARLRNAIYDVQRRVQL